MNVTVGDELGAVLLCAMGWALARDGRRQLRGGGHALRSTRARAISELAGGALFALFGLLVALRPAFAGRPPRTLGWIAVVVLLAVGAVGVGARALAGVARLGERRQAMRINRELGIDAPPRALSPWIVMVGWAALATLACLVWAIVWALHHPGTAIPQATINHVINTGVPIFAGLCVAHMAVQCLRRYNRDRQLDWLAHRDAPVQDPLRGLFPGGWLLRPAVLRAAARWLLQLWMSRRAPVPNLPRWLI